MKIASLILAAFAVVIGGCTSVPVEYLSVQQYANKQLREFHEESKNGCPYGVKDSVHKNTSRMRIDYDSSRVENQYNRRQQRKEPIIERQQYDGDANVTCLNETEARAMKQTKSPVQK